MGMTFMVTSHMARQQILGDTKGTETDVSRALLDSMDIIFQQMVYSQIAYNYYKALNEAIAEIPLIEDQEPT
jgi:hypothetical protein